MSLLSKLNKFVDIGVKITVLIVAFSVALFPIAFIFGHETLHQQQWNESFDELALRKADIEEAKALDISNIHWKESGSVTSSDIESTFRLADFVCYSLHDQGSAVVRRNFQTKGKKKAKKGQDKEGILKGYKTSQSLGENPPLKQLKNKLSKYVDFESEALTNKHWVIAITGELDPELLKEIESINDKNPEYKFTIVSPLPLKHKIFKNSASKTETEVETPEASETVQEVVSNTEENDVSNNEKDDSKEEKKEEKKEDKKKGKKQKSKTKVKKVEAEEEVPAEKPKQQL